MANLIAAAAPPTARSAQRLKATDAIKHAIMTAAKLSCNTATDTGEYRHWIRGKFRRKIVDLASAITEATEQLAEVGLLKEDKDTKKKSEFYTKVSRRRVQFYKKVSWEELNEDAKSEAARLQIPRSTFE